MFIKMKYIWNFRLWSSHHLSQGNGDATNRAIMYHYRPDCFCNIYIWKLYHLCCTTKDIHFLGNCQFYKPNRQHLFHPFPIWKYATLNAQNTSQIPMSSVAIIKFMKTSWHGTLSKLLDSCEGSAPVISWFNWKGARDKELWSIRWCC